MRTIPFNYVQIKPDPTPTKMGSIHLPIEYIQNTHKTVSGTVMETPEKILYYGREIQEIAEATIHRTVEERLLLNDYNEVSAEHQVVPVVRRNDKVYFLYNQADYDRMEFGLIDYTAIIAYERNGVVVPINGYVLVSKVPKPKIISGIATSYKDEYFAYKFIVEKVGELIPHYKSYPGIYDVDDVFVGDTIIANPSSAFRVENDLFKKLGKDYYAVRRKDIYAKIVK